MPRLSIIIVTHNSASEIGPCLTSLVNSRTTIDHEVVVVDNASRDGTGEAVRRAWPDVRLVDAGGNRGFAAANNLGFRHTSGELVLLLNPDTVVPPGAIDALVAQLDRRPEVAVVGPRLLDESGRAELSFGTMIGPLAELRQKMLGVGYRHQVPILGPYVERLTRRSRTVDWVSGACLLVRRADADTVGLLDERYFMYTEDVDFCAAIRARGRAVLFEASVEIRHLRGRSVASAPGATSAGYRRSQLAFYRKHHPRWAPVLRAYLTLRGLAPDNHTSPGP